MSPERPRAAGRQPSSVAAQPPPAGRALLHRLRWTVLRPLAARFGGDERSLFRGPGLELVEVRAYQPGDDVRRIDWNVTARADGIYVRETRAERALTVWLVVDVSPSLDWGTAACLKRERGAEFVAIVGQLLGGHGNRVGALTFADRPLAIIPPGTGRAHTIRLLARLREAAAPPGRGPTDLAAALDQAGRVIRGPAVVLVISDFLVPDGWEPALRRLTVRHEVVAVRLSDPREGDLPDVGLLTLEDPETGRQLVIDTADRRLRERFRAAAAAQSERLRAALARCGVELLALGTEADLLPRLAAFLDARRQRRGQRAVAQTRPSVALPGGT